MKKLWKRGDCMESIFSGISMACVPVAVDGGVVGLGWAGQWLWKWSGRERSARPGIVIRLVMVGSKGSADVGLARRDLGQWTWTCGYNNRRPH